MYAVQNKGEDIVWGFCVLTKTLEIILRPYQFCNLSEVVVRAEDTFKDLREKVRLATILGTIQSTYTKFPYLRKIWQRNTEEERLLGVSLTGIMDHKVLGGAVDFTAEGYVKEFDGFDWDRFCEDESLYEAGKGYGLDDVLDALKQVAVDTNKEWADKLGIPQATAVTCVKPSGTVSQLVDSASGIHTRHSEYYIRTVRGDNKDPLTEFMIAQGIPHEPCVMKPETTTVFSFPQKSPEGAITREDVSALDQLELWLTYQRHWCEHKPSVTISVKEDEWMEVGAFVYKNFDEMSGVSFLPYDGGSYQQAPYQECSKEEYEELLGNMPKDLDWELLSEYEVEDNTAGMQTMACSSGACEIVDLT